MQHTSSARRSRGPLNRPDGRAAALVWRSPERHLWVATAAGEYAGMTVYDRRRGYTAIGPTATAVGRFRSLAAAKAALEADA